MLKDGVKFILALLFAILVMLAVRAWAFTIFSVPDSSYAPEFRKGDRWIVNRLDCTNLHKGDDLVFRQDSVSYPGRLVALPGDTVIWHGVRYRIPVTFPHCCDCPYCDYYMLQVGKRKVLVCRYQLIGKAYRLFHLDL
ncbi:MAG: S26 family signal peptidase [Prevotella sp.]|jgi:signal peptidase I|nr:S26 family signal peptidase [Prevotella sp.]MCH3986295.1 S26 family signal peptidase [Prevotella sp.]MCH3992860.1 S26 family signal peptidase [Prevotella sp.]MCH4018952.1 S26 family signal peptidase [Prevotella sp.]MCH4099440.1 S26 family signal peptidase [Prevotella sp.]